MNRRIAKFEKVSYEQFYNDMMNTFMVEDIAYLGGLEYKVSGEYDKAAIDSVIKNMYKNIKLPRRATEKSAGYDFFAPFDIHISSMSSIVIPTGIKCRIDDEWYLKCCPRSGLGFKYGVSLSNTIGVIDADYYNNEKNEGHIHIKLLNDACNSDNIFVQSGNGFCQGIFEIYGLTEDDECATERVGGFGSTGGVQ